MGMSYLRWAIVGVMSCFAVAAGCSDDDATPAPTTTGAGATGNAGGAGGEGGSGGAGPTGPWPLLECDPLVPEVCGYPFPNNVFTVDDPDSGTGRRVRLNTAMIPSGGPEIDPTVWNASDGFSAGVAMLAYFEDVSLEGLPRPDSIDLSISAASPTVIVNFETGERVPHFAEIDMSNDEDEARSFMLRPAVRLEDGTRYIVAMRNLQDDGGDPIEPSAAFEALRDGTPLDDEPSVEARRELYDEIFERLENVGVAREDLQLAWDFTTASDENNTGWMVHMRDEGLEILGDEPSFRITDVDTDFSPEIAFRLFGTMTVPQYLDDPEPGATLLFGEDGMPEPNRAAPTYEVEWEMLIPQSALLSPAKIVQYGHGLLGSKSQIEADHFRTFMNTYNYAFFAVDLAGMAEEDEGWIGGVLANGNLDQMARMFDRMHQGVLNNLLAMRMVYYGLLQDETYGPLLDGSERSYFGISQGGIFGGVYLALSTDVERGAVEVMGQSYNFLLSRSVDFEPFFAILAFVYPKSADQQIVLQLIQMLWDRVEPNGYSHHVTSDPLPGTRPKQVLLRAALGDHQVTTLGAHVMARAMNAGHLPSGLPNDIWGLEKVSSGETDATYIEYDFGLPPDPVCNIPMDLCEDPHGKLRKLDEARIQLDEFLRTGVVVNACTDGVCSFPALSGCTGGETAVGLCGEGE